MLLTGHTFHIPVMGLAFTIDSPLKVARFGIASVVSITEDRLIEMMRKHYYGVVGEYFKSIPEKDPDHRAKRITDYLNLINRMVNDQIEKLKELPFRAGSELVKYFEMLPGECKLRQLYTRMLESKNDLEKESLQTFLRSQVKPGSIDVNIMTKLDKPFRGTDGNEVPENSDALAALRGYALSNLTNSSVVLSAGMNPRLFNYLETFRVFDATGWGEFRKRVIIKVSDFRSAHVQGKMLAKKGIWVSEFRIESGLNCGGHAFATDGLLLGPILQEFKDKRAELVSELHGIYNNACAGTKRPLFDRPHPQRITVQGGIGTATEDRFLRSFYDVDGTGWGTPFLLCPEATTVDEPTLRQLQKAGKDDVVLSSNSPLGVRFHYLRGTSGEHEKEHRISHNRPGSPCTEKHLVNNTEFTAEPICTASRKYQSLKLAQLKELQLPPAEFDKQARAVLDKECLCVGLSNSAAFVYNIPFVRRSNGVTICPGPNITNFSKIVSLKQMVDHIYGRGNVMTNPNRPHMFINELNLYIDYLAELTENHAGNPRSEALRVKFGNNLLAGIKYYREESTLASDTAFVAALYDAEEKIKTLANIILRDVKEIQLQ